MRTAILFLTLTSLVGAQSPRNVLGWGDEVDPSDAVSRGMGEAGAARIEKDYVVSLQDGRDIICKI